jgi:hypothetical protein
MNIVNANLFSVASKWQCFGLLNQEQHNQALSIKQLHKFHMKENNPLVKLVWSLYGNSIRSPDVGINGSSFLLFL